MNARLLILAAVAAFIGCRDGKPVTDLAAPSDPSKVILDGAHGGNKDFWFLPPLVPLPRNNPDFEVGKFNNTLRSSLKIQICELKSENLNSQGLPTETTGCVAGAPIKTFAPGTVQLVNLPLRQNGWWTLFGLPSDGFYYVLWDTRQSRLNVNKYYRIAVLVDGSAAPLGIADVDPMANLFQWKYTNTGQVIQLVNDVLLPIPFRVEKGGGTTLCGGATVCASATISNNSPSGSQILTVDGGAGAIAGVKFPNGWLPATGPQNVVVTIAQADLGTTNPTTGAQTNPCHVGLALQQFAGCFRFTTTPHLAAIDESGRQFATPVIGAVCYVLYGTGDPREKFAEMYASGLDEPPHVLEDASDAGILSANTRNCSTSTEVIGAAGGNRFTRFAGATWRKVKSGTGHLFGVNTAYGIDLGLGGYLQEFSNVGPALSATIQAVSPTQATATIGANFQVFVRVVGSNHHDGQHRNETGLGGIPIAFAVAEGSGTISQLGEEGGGGAQLVATTNTLPIDAESQTSGGGYAAANWHVPAVPGTYRVIANGPAFGGPITFVVNVIPLNAQFVRVCGITDGTATPTFADLRTAVSAVAPNGVVSVCSGTHAAPFVNLTGKSITIVGEEGVIPTLDGGGQSAVFFIGSQNSDNTVVTLRHLRLQNATFSDVDIERNFGSVLIDDVQFFPAHGTPPNPADPTLAYSSGVFVFSTSGSPVAVQNSIFTNGDIGVHVNNAANVVVTNNVFENQSNAGIHGDGGGITASRNLVHYCGPHWCIGLFGSAGRGNNRLLNNTIVLSSAASERNAIQAYNTVAELTGNVIAVENFEVPPGFSAWPMNAGVAVDGGSDIIFNRNQIGVARFGLLVYNGTSVTGSGNFIGTVGQALSFFESGTVTITNSNFTNYTAALGGATTSVALRCNWWGSVDGPVNVIGSIDPVVYTPWAREPITNVGAC